MTTDVQPPLLAPSGDADIAALMDATGLNERELLSAFTAEKARRSLLTFSADVFPGFVTAPHHIAIADALERVERGEISRLLIQVPPRHGKSLLASELFPPWYLGRNPDNRIIACSYSVDLAFDFSRKARNLIASPQYKRIFPGVTLASDARALGQWELTSPHTGGYVSAGVGGGITGKGAHVLLVDDPVKNREEASSQTVLDAHWNWYTSTAYTRLEGSAAVIVIQTRWSEDDMAGRLLSAMKNRDADQWHVVNLPARAETSDVLGRDVDAPLWPEKFDAKALDRIRVTIGPRDFDALYQQRPSNALGTLFKRHWWGRYSAFDPGSAQQIIQVWDTAFQAKQTADFSVCSTWALTPIGVYLLDVFRDRVEYPDLKRKAKDLFAKWRPHAVLVEDKASGQSLIQDLARNSSLPIIPVKADSDKVLRATAVTGYVEAGKVFLPDNAAWVDTWIEEHAAFPNGAHDDQVDTTSIALKRLFIEPRTFRALDVSSAVDANLAPDELLFA